MSEQVIELEIKVSFLENHIRELDGVLTQLMTRLERAERDITELREERGGASTLGTPDQEVPPHHVHL